MSMVRYTRKELNENFSGKQDAEIERLLAKGTVPDDQLGVVSGNGKYSTLRIFTPTSFNDIQHGIFA